MAIGISIFSSANTPCTKMVSVSERSHCEQSEIIGLLDHEMSKNVPMLDHLVYATPDLEATCRDLEIRLGVRASAGGQHPGRGTHNALLSIGPRAYLEIIAPDPLQPEIRPVWFGLDQLTAPKLITWAMRVGDLEAFVKEISPM
ncbi:MAG: hypothetical protein V7638_664 [Acidobacteriota bacterium]